MVRFPVTDPFLTAGSAGDPFGGRATSEAATEAHQRAQDALKDALLKVIIAGAYEDVLLS